MTIENYNHPIAPDERSTILKNSHSSSLFKHLSDEDYEIVSQSLQILELEDGEIFFRTGDKADRMFLVYSGATKITNILSSGKEQIYYIYRKFDFVGGLNLLSQEDYLYTGHAIADSIVLAVPAYIFFEYLAVNNDVLKEILRMSFERIRWAEDLINRLSTANASMKTAGLLLHLMKERGMVTERGVQLELALNREELGNFSGLTRETLTRKLGEFKELGYIDMEGNRLIYIKDMDALEAYLY